MLIIVFFPHSTYCEQTQLFVSHQTFTYFQLKHSKRELILYYVPSSQQGSLTSFMPNPCAGLWTRYGLCGQEGAEKEAHLCWVGPGSAKLSTESALPGAATSLLMVTCPFLLAFMCCGLENQKPKPEKCVERRYLGYNWSSYCKSEGDCVSRVLCLRDK